MVLWTAERGSTAGVMETRARRSVPLLILLLLAAAVLFAFPVPGRGGWEAEPSPRQTTSIAKGLGPLKLADVFQDGMVLQASDPPARIWGTGAPGATVGLSAFKGYLRGRQFYETTVDASGSWLIELDWQWPSSKGETYQLGLWGGDAFERNPPDITVNHAVQSPPIYLSDVVFGHVLLCAGQSNMELPLDYLRGSAELIAATPTHTHLRLSSDLHQAPFVAAKAWSKPSVETASSFSGLCYMAALQLGKYLTANEPIGLVAGARDATAILSWFSEDDEAARGACSNVSAEAVQHGHFRQEFDEKLRRFAPMAFKAVVFYQGESDAFNVSRHVHRYGCLYKTMVEQWRRTFRSPQLPFVGVQLAAWNSTPYYPFYTGVPYLRVLQAGTEPGHAWLARGAGLSGRGASANDEIENSAMVSMRCPPPLTSPPLAPLPRPASMCPPPSTALPPSLTPRPRALRRAGRQHRLV
jgi:hypothetical protein